MNKKIIGILICILLIATAVPVGVSLKNNAINSTVPSIPLISMTANWTQMQKMLASVVGTGGFDCSVSLSGDTALIGALGPDIGRGYVFTYTSGIWTQQAKLLASDGAAGDYFGSSVSLSGDTALIGAYADDDNGDASGSAYVFTRTGTTWTQQAKLLASDGAAGDCFGLSVSVDGNTALIGAYADDDNGVFSGSTYVFTRTGATWTQQQKLLASDGAAGDYFGWSVSLDGDTALIGANVWATGSAYVFTRIGATWTQQAKLLASDGEEGDWFGYSVALDGDTALIGEPDDDDNGYGSGSAYVFIKESPTVVYVDDDFDSSTPGWQYDHFNYIQDRINAVAEHGTVYVYSGTYYERININKNYLTLFGENKNNTIIDSGSFPNWPTVSIGGIHINFSGFTIRNGNGDVGIVFGSGGYNTISNNIITSCGAFAYWYALQIGGNRLGHEKLFNNQLIGNGANIGNYALSLSDFFFSMDTTNTVNGKPVYYLVNQSNLIIDPLTYPEIGYLAIINSNNITVKNLNSIEANRENVLFAYTNNSRIENVDFSNFGYSGIQLLYSNNNTIKNSLISNHLHGLKIDNSYDNLITNSSITNNYWTGVDLGGKYNSVIGNNINNYGRNIALYGSNFSIYHNNFLGGGTPWLIESSNSTWDNGSHLEVTIGTTTLGQIIIMGQTRTSLGLMELVTHYTIFLMKIT